MRGRLFLFLICFSIFGVTPAYACMCENKTEQVVLEGADFIGEVEVIRVESVREYRQLFPVPDMDRLPIPIGKDAKIYRLKQLSAIKGNISVADNMVDIAGNCSGGPLEIGGVYRIIAFKDYDGDFYRINSKCYRHLDWKKFGKAR